MHADDKMLEYHQSPNSLLHTQTPKRVHVHLCN